MTTKRLRLLDLPSATVHPVLAAQQVQAPEVSKRVDGDTIVLHVAGHGVQVPQAAPLQGGAPRVPAPNARWHSVSQGGSLARTRVQGVFSFEVAGALASGARTAGELSASLGARYAARRTTPPPLLAGEGLIFSP